jgi:hypothetical protein
LRSNILPPPKVEPNWYEQYGGYNAKILRNWVDPDPKCSGYLTQRNTDNYAYFALAKYAERQIGHHLSSPSPDKEKLTDEPRDLRIRELPMSKQGVPKQGQHLNLILGDEQGSDDTPFSGYGDNLSHKAFSVSTSCVFGKFCDTVDKSPADKLDLKRRFVWEPKLRSQSYN